MTSTLPIAEPVTVPLSAAQTDDLTLLTAEQVGALVNMTGDGIRHRHRSRQLRGIIIAGKLRFRPSAVQQWIKNIEDVLPREWCAKANESGKTDTAVGEAVANVTEQTAAPDDDSRFRR